MPDVSGLAKARRAFGQSIPDPVALEQSLENLPPANTPSAPTFASALVHDALLATEALDAATALAESLALQAGTRSMGEYAQLGGAAAVPHAESVDVSGTGHMVAGDKNDIFTDAVMEFLGRTFTEHAAD